MTGQTASERLKLRTTRTTAALLLGAVAVTLLGTCLEALAPTAAELAREHTQRTIFNAAGSTVVLFATIAGVLAVTSEFRYGTIRPTLVLQPRRRVVLAAKLAAAAGVGAQFAVVCLAAGFLAGWAILAARGVDLALTDAHAATLVFGTIAAGALGAVIGVALGTLIRGQAAAVIAVAVYAVLVDAALFAAAPSVGRFLPGKAGDALTGRPVDDLLSPGVGALLLVVWALLFVVAAAGRNECDDI